MPLKTANQLKERIAKIKEKLSKLKGTAANSPEGVLALRRTHKALKRFQRRWRQKTGKKLALARKGSEGEKK